jgi:hypothetical protein
MPYAANFQDYSSVSCPKAPKEVSCRPETSDAKNIIEEMPEHGPCCVPPDYSSGNYEDGECSRVIMGIGAVKFVS